MTTITLLVVSLVVHELPNAIDLLPSGADQSRMIGVSTHPLEQARNAVLEGANYIGVGPVFPSQTKQFDEHMGVELVKSVVAEIQLPSYAIGGIDNDNIVALIEAGCRHVAVSNVILSADDPASATRALRTRLKGD